MIGIIFLIAYAAVMIIATILLSRKSDNKDNFYVGNRNMGVFTSALSIAATWFWAPALFTSSEKAYTNGFAGLFWFLGLTETNFTRTITTRTRFQSRIWNC